MILYTVQKFQIVKPMATLPFDIFPDSGRDESTQKYPKFALKI